MANGHGGLRDGAGRTPGWLKEKCREIIDKEKLVEFMGDVAAGKDFPQLATSDGEVLPLPPPLKERRAAVEWLVDHGYGKVPQGMELSDANGDPLFGLPTAALTELVTAIRQRNPEVGGAKP